jgi:hypothetical protein
VRGDYIMMDMHSRNEYLKVLREKYLRARTRKEKTEVLDEYCLNTGQARKYVIRKMQPGVDLRPKQRKKRKETYDGEVKAALARVWEIFDYPCGQRLKPILETEVDRLRELGELKISDDVALKLRGISSATIDRKLAHQRQVLHLLRLKGGPKPGSLLKQKIPIRLTQWDTSQTGYVEMDLVVHCGSSILGEYINTLSTTEISSGWWEGEAIMGKAQEHTFQALKEIRGRTPFEWKGVDSDNGGEFINDILYKYCQREKLLFTRSRPSRKNDNAYIEQKNWTHVRKVLGYLRYDTVKELMIINDLYEGDLRLYKNFFQPVMKLVSKERIGGHVKRKYDTPKTPCQRLMESGQIPEEAKRQLEGIYLSLNPAQLKRSIDAKLDKLYRTYERKGGSQQVNPMRKTVPHIVTSFMIQQPKVGLPT